MRNIKRMEIHEDLVRRLAEKHHPVTERSIFPTMRELLCFAAVLGFREGKRTPLQGNTQEIDARVWEHSPQAVDIVYLIALADQRDAAILRLDREDEMMRIFEEYAATGLVVIDSWLKEFPADMNGDQAIMAAFRAKGVLKRPSATVDQALDSIQF